MKLFESPLKGGRVSSLVAALMMLSACSGGGSSSESPLIAESGSKVGSESLAQSVSNSPPVARIGGQYSTRVVRPGETVVLDGSASYDPDGDPLSYEWTLVGTPPVSTAYLSDTAAVETSFVADMAGDYAVELIVSDLKAYSEPADATVTADEHTPVSLNWGLESKIDTGEDPGIAINNGGIVVEVHESPSTFDLWYRVGIIQGGAVDWGGSHRYDSGIKPSVDINDAGVVVEMHGNEIGTHLWYHVGQVNVANKTISFGPSHRHVSGRWPSIAINNPGHVIEVHGSEGCIPGVAGCGLWYHVGEVDVDARRINFGGSKAYDDGLVPSVDINDAGLLVEVHKSENFDDLWYWTGQLNVASQNFTKLDHGRYDTGVNPDVAINNAGRVVEVHESETTVTLWSAVGFLSANGDLNLGAPAPYSLGLVPVVGLNDRDEFVAMQDYGDISFLPTSILLFLMTKDFLPGKNTDRWMELTPTMHRKTLRSILLPGTHDSAAYILHTNSNSGPVNARGPDWKGLEEACANIKEGWLGDRLREKCEELLPQLFPHTENEIAKDVTLAQSQSLGDQLYGGIRFFDLRVTPRDGAYRAYHGLIGDPAAPMLDEIRAFMDMVAMELVLIDVSHLNVGTHEKNDHRGYTDQEHDALMALLVTKLGPYLIRRDDRSSKNLLDTPFRQLTADGPRIILVYSDKYLDNHPEHPLADYFWPADFFFGAFTNTTELRYQVYGDGEDLVGQRERFDEFLAGSRSDLFRLYQTLTADSNLTAKNFVFDRVLGSHYRPTLHGLSQDTNQHLSQFLDEGVPDFPNLALVDFYEESDVVGRAIEISGLCDQTAIAGSLEVNPPSTWPPNHSMATVEVDVSGLESRNPDSFDALISAIDVEELDRKTGEDIYGPNNFEPDWEIIGDLTALIRSEREGRAESRYYVITVTASDCSGDYDFRAAVPVPHDHGH